MHPALAMAVGLIEGFLVFLAPTRFFDLDEGRVFVERLISKRTRAPQKEQDSIRRLPSTVHMISVVAYKVALLVVLVAAGTSSAGLTYYYQGRTNNLSNQVTNLNRDADSTQGQINALKSQIDSLNQQVAQLQSQNSQLQAQLASRALQGDILIGDLLPLTGDLASFGSASKAATELAKDDVNAYLSTAGATWDVKLVEEDTATNPSQTLSMTQTLFAQGVKFIVGPQSSGELRYIKDYVNANHLVLISQSSTAVDLGIPNDYVFRFAPNDTFQGLAIGRAMRNSGAIVLVQMYRNDAWGVGVSDSSATAFTNDGGVVLWNTKTAYDPANGVTGTALATNTAALELDVRAALGSPSVNGNATRVAVQLLSFDEGGMFLHEAGSNPTAYPNLNNPKLRWFGSDGIAQSILLTADTGASAFAQQHVFLNTVFGAPPSVKLAALQERMTAKLGFAPDPYAYAAYDAVWVLALSIQAAGKYDSLTVQKILSNSYRSTATAPYYGASGTVVLNSVGDRAFSDEDLWTVQGSGSTWNWVLVSHYNYATDSIGSS